MLYRKSDKSEKMDLPNLRSPNRVGEDEAQDATDELNELVAEWHKANSGIFEFHSLHSVHSSLSCLGEIDWDKHPALKVIYEGFNQNTTEAIKECGCLLAHALDQCHQHDFLRENPGKNSAKYSML